MNSSAENQTRRHGENPGPGRTCLTALALAVLALSAASAAVTEPVNGPDLVLWLDAQDIAGKASPARKPSSGDPIATWADKSSYRNNAQQTIPSQRPIGVCEAAGGEVPSVRFHAASRQYLSVRT